MTGYLCKWCNTLVNSNVEKFDPETGMLVWTGCRDCYEKRKPRTDTA